MWMSSTVSKLKSITHYENHFPLTGGIYPVMEGWFARLEKKMHHVSTTKGKIHIANTSTGCRKDIRTFITAYSS